jgi:hypothetical protein
VRHFAVRTAFFKTLRLPLISICLLTVSARAGDFAFNFDGVDPGPGGLGLYEQFGSAHWVQNGDGTGYLSLTDAINDQLGVVVFQDFDGGLIVKAFKVEMDVRIGGGTASPGEGLSISYARADDPVFTQAPDGFACSPAGACNLVTGMAQPCFGSKVVNLLHGDRIKLQRSRDGIFHAVVACDILNGRGLSVCIRSLDCGLDAIRVGLIGSSLAFRRGTRAHASAGPGV